MATDDADAVLKISAARLIAIEKQPYLASALFAMTPTFTDKVHHISADERWRIYFNPYEAMSYTVQELSAFWLHQVAHCLRGHAQRFKALGEEPSKAKYFQQAADALINQDLLASKISIPSNFRTLNTLREWGYQIPENPSTESLYQLLLKESKSTQSSNPDEGDSGNDFEPQQQNDCGSCSDGQRREYESSDGESNSNGGDGSVTYDRAESLRAFTAVQIRHYEKQGNQASAAFSRWAQSLLNPEVDWRQELASLIRKDVAQRVGLRHHTYSRPSRRQASVSALGQGTILPSMRENAPPMVAVIVDTSGSINAEQIDVAISEVRGILQAIGNSEKGIIFISCDSEAHLSRVKQMSEVSLVGGGGTDMRVGISLAQEQRPKPELIVVITDGDTPWPKGPVGNETVLAVLTEKNHVAKVPRWIRTINVS